MMAFGRKGKPRPPPSHPSLRSSGPGPPSRQPVCPALTPDAEINASPDTIVSHFRCSQVRPWSGGLAWHLECSGDLEELGEDRVVRILLEGP